MVAAIKHSPEDRLVELMAAYELPLFRFVFVLVGNREVALDCTQETFTRAYQQLGGGRSINRQWLYTVARNLVMDEFRRRKHEQADLEALEQLPMSDSMPVEQRVAMRQAFAALGPEDRSLLYLFLVEGRRGAEIAELLGIGHSAVRMRIGRARERFRRLYGGDR